MQEKEERMAEELGGWQRHSEERCRRCSITTAVNDSGYCRKCWGKKIIECVEEERRKEADAWLREREEKSIQDEAEKAKKQRPPVLKERVLALEETVLALEKRVDKIERWLPLPKKGVV